MRMTFALTKVDGPPSLSWRPEDNKNSDSHFSNRSSSCLISESWNIPVFLLLNHFWFFAFFFETGFCYAAQAGLELSVLSCLSLLSAGTGVYHHTWVFPAFGQKPLLFLGLKSAGIQARTIPSTLQGLQLVYYRLETCQSP
jgi:hypothetical protein